jgi:hypothetical protein
MVEMSIHQLIKNDVTSVIYLISWLLHPGMLFFTC